MKYIYIDESGDLGFKETSSKCFIFTAVIVDDDRVLERVVKKIWKTLKNKRRGELHATHENDITRRRLLNMVNNIPTINIISAFFYKQEIRKEFQNNKNSLYSRSLCVLIETLFKRSKTLLNGNISIFLDKTLMKKVIRDELVKNINNLIKIKYNKNYIIDFISSQDNKSIQATDFISWGIFKKYESDDDSYLRLIKDKILSVNKITI